MFITEVVSMLIGDYHHINPIFLYQSNGLGRGKFQRFLNFFDIHGILILAAAAIKNFKE